MDGFATLEIVHGKYSLIELPVIMLTDSHDMAEALKLGADYVPKPLDIDVVLARIQTQLMLASRINPDNYWYPVS
ncbi:MAG: hypothetical protein OQL06_00540 [Gammaproteobacteria bacterium]|nr:hypothetical protein [Gammaproteobacteria bacterium]